MPRCDFLSSFSFSFTHFSVSISHSPSHLLFSIFVSLQFQFYPSLVPPICFTLFIIPIDLQVAASDL